MQHARRLMHIPAQTDGTGRNEQGIEMTRKDMTLTSSGFYVSQEAPIHTDNPVPTPTASAPDILRCAYMELVVTDLAASREFYVDVLGLYVTEEDERTVYLRSTEEFIHH